MQNNNNDNFLNEINPNILTESSAEDIRKQREADQEAARKAEILENAKNEKKAYLEQLKEPVDNSYTAKNNFRTRLWQEPYKIPSLEVVDKKTGKISINEYGYLSDRIVDNIEVNTEKGIGATVKNNIQLKTQKYRTDLYAFAASMRNEVYLEKDGKFNDRSFLQFCTRIYDGNNKAINNLVKGGYFGNKFEHIYEINFEKFILGCANEVFKTNVLLPEDMDTPDVKYSELYSEFRHDIINATDNNIENSNSKKYNIDYSVYADKEQDLQYHQFEVGSSKYMYRIPTMTPFQHFVKEEIKIVEEEPKVEVFKAEDAKTEEKVIEQVEPNAEEVKTEETSVETKPVEQKLEPVNEEVKEEEPEVDMLDENVPIPLNDKQRKNLKREVNKFIKQIIKGEYDAQKDVPEELKNTTASFAKGVKAAFEDFPNWQRLPEDVRKEAAREFKYNLDKNIDGEKQAAQSLKDFYGNLHYNRDNIDKNNPNHIQMLDNMKKDGLHVDALSSYFRLTEIHEKRNGVFWLFHPFQNKAEKAAIAEMKEVLKEDFNMTDKELEPYYIDKNGNKKLNSPKLGDEMIDSIMQTCDKNTSKLLADQKQMREEQCNYYMKATDSPEETIKLDGNKVKFNIDDIYPELYGINNLSKSVVNKEKTVEKGKDI